jgi:hypothetical protein
LNGIKTGGAEATELEALAAEFGYTLFASKVFLPSRRAIRYLVNLFAEMVERQALVARSVHGFLGGVFAGESYILVFVAALVVRSLPNVSAALPDGHSVG